MMSFASVQASSYTQNTYNNPDSRDLPEREEINQTYQLSPGARVEISGMNGYVNVETVAGSSTAEVHIVRSAYNRDDLNYRKITIEQTSAGLVVRGEKNSGHSNWYGNREVRERVMMKIPRQVEFVASGINGKATVGEIDGPAQLSGINGTVDVAQAVGYTHISGVNGRVTMTLSRLGERGVSVSGVNGGVTLRFTDELNADLDVSGVNGNVSTDMPNVTVLGKFSRQNYHAKIGAGGSPITVSGVNGHVRIERAAT